MYSAYSRCWLLLSTCTRYGYSCVYINLRFNDGYDYFVLVLFLLIPSFLLIRKRMFTASQSFDGFNRCDWLAMLSSAPWSDSRCVLLDNIIMPYVHDNPLPDGFSPFALQYDKFQPEMWAAASELGTLKYSWRPARAQLVRDRAAHKKGLPGIVLFTKRSGASCSLCLPRQQVRFLLLVCLSAGKKLVSIWRRSCLFLTRYVYYSLNSIVRNKCTTDSASWLAKLFKRSLLDLVTTNFSQASWFWSVWILDAVWLCRGILIYQISLVFWHISLSPKCIH